MVRTTEKRLTTGLSSKRYAYLRRKIANWHNLSFVLLYACRSWRLALSKRASSSGWSLSAKSRQYQKARRNSGQAIQRRSQVRRVLTRSSLPQRALTFHNRMFSAWNDNSAISGVRSDKRRYGKRQRIWNKPNTVNGDSWLVALREGHMLSPANQVAALEHRRSSPAVSQHFGSMK